MYKAVKDLGANTRLEMHIFTDEKGFDVAWSLVLFL
jgi:hypothetical protein